MLLGGLFFELGELNGSGIVLFEVHLLGIRINIPDLEVGSINRHREHSIGMHEEGGISLSLMQSCIDPSPTIIVQARTAQIMTSCLSKSDDVLAICEIPKDFSLVNRITRKPGGSFKAAFTDGLTTTK
ncbi:hypothetical protein AKJ16_DCAP16790 [Drosera capensis]